MIISTSLGSGQVRWPGIPAEHNLPFKNVEYVDDLFTWAEAEAVLDDSDLTDDQDEDEGWADDDAADEEVTL
jgi:hypothetical protein